MVNCTKRLAVLTFLVTSSALSAAPAKAQGTGAQAYGRQTWVEAKKQEKINKKAAKQRQKAMKKYDKAQRKAAKHANKNANKTTYTLAHR